MWPSFIKAASRTVGLAELKAAGYTAAEAIEANWTVAVLKTAGYEAHELRAANCSAGMLRGRESWLFTFVAKILAADGGAISLLDATAAEALRARRPTYAKVEMWHYMMAAPLSDILYAEVRRDPPEICPR